MPENERALKSLLIKKDVVGSLSSANLLDVSTVEKKKEKYEREKENERGYRTIGKVVEDGPGFE